MADVAAEIDALFPTLASLSDIERQLAEGERQHKLLRDKLLVEEAEFAKLSKTVQQDAAKKLAEISNLKRKRASAYASGQELASRMQPLLASIEPLVKQISDLEAEAAITTLLQRVDERVAAINATLATDPRASLPLFDALFELVGEVTAAPYPKLRAHVTQKVEALEKTIHTHLIKHFRTALTQMGWPKPVDSRDVTPETLASFRSYFIDLAKLSLAEAKKGAQQQSDKTLLPLELLFEPIIKAFRFHFQGNKETNRIDKPEWYYAHVTSLVASHVDFLTGEVQDLLNGVGAGVNAKNMFIRILVERCLRPKLLGDMPMLLKDDNYFSHAVSETLGFEEAFSNTTQYPRSEIGCLLLFSNQPEALDKWIAVDAKVARARLVDLMAASDHFAPLGGGGDEAAEELRPSVSADRLMTMLMAITERFSSLPRTEDQLRFVEEVEVRLLFDYLAQIDMERSNTLKGAVTPRALERVTNLLNTLQYVDSVLQDWAEDVNFMYMQYYKKTGKNFTDVAKEAAEHESKGGDAAEILERVADVEGSVFDRVVDAYRDEAADITVGTITFLVDAFIVSTRAYSRDKRLWSSQAVDMHALPSDITPSVFDALEELRGALVIIEAGLSPSLFAKLLKPLTTELSGYIWKDIVMKQRFSLAGAYQFERDMRALYNIFELFAPKPEAFFAHLIDATTILCMRPDLLQGLLKTLKQIIQKGGSDAELDEASDAVLKAHKISKLDASSVIDMSKRRADMATADGR